MKSYTLFHRGLQWIHLIAIDCQGFCHCTCDAHFNHNLGRRLHSRGVIRWGMGHEFGGQADKSGVSGSWKRTLSAHSYFLSGSMLQSGVEVCCWRSIFSVWRCQNLPSARISRSGFKIAKQSQDNTGDVFLYQGLELLGVAIVVFQVGSGWADGWALLAGFKSQVQEVVEWMNERTNEWMNMPVSKRDLIQDHFNLPTPMTMTALLV